MSIPRSCIRSSWVLGLVIATAVMSPAQNVDRDHSAAIEAEVERLAAEWEAARARAAAWAERTATPLRGQVDGRDFELIDVVDGRPVYHITTNDRAAISTAAAAVRDAPFYGAPDGTGQRIGIWDGGQIRFTHQEFVGRLVSGDGGSTSSHGSHVGGTLGASGVNPSARGMAPGATIHTYAWGSDTAEALAIAATASGQPNRIKVSNHSYGAIEGWENGSYSGNQGWHWFGEWGDDEDEKFGRYNGTSAAWDNVCHQAPYYLPFRSAGNDRNDGPPNSMASFFYLDNGWQTNIFDPAIHPGADGLADDGSIGFDSVGTRGTSKNIMTVGAVSDAVSGGLRSVSSASVASFSGWGPTDDGRIKPDIVANGVSLFSTGSNSDTSYYNSSGTSMSSPNAAGSAVLLHEVWSTRLGFDLRASSMKALILHTTDDLGNPGPDYAHGWGLMNTQRAADLILDHEAAPDEGRVAEEFLDLADSMRIHDLDVDGTEPLRVTICWTDPPSPSISGLDNPTPTLMNDLDIRVVRVADGTVFDPWILDPSNPTLVATTGDNFRDNVEQIYVATPIAGSYRLEISHKASLVGNRQDYSVITSGATRRTVPAASIQILTPGCAGLNGLPQLVTTTMPFIDSTFIVIGGSASANAGGFVATSLGSFQGSLLPQDCPLYVDPNSVWNIEALSTNVFGGWATQFYIPNLPPLAGFVFRLQGFFTSTQTSWGWMTTPGVEATIGY